MIALSTRSLRQPRDNVVSLFKLFEEGRNLGRIMLQIAIHRENAFALRMVEARRQCRGLSKVATKFHHQHPAIHRRNLFQQLVAAVGRAIVHQHQLKTLTDLLHDRLQLVIERGDIFFFIVKRDDNRVFRHDLSIIDPFPSPFWLDFGQNSHPNPSP